MSNDKPQTGAFKGYESTIKIDSPASPQGSELDQEFQWILEETLDRPLQEITKTLEHKLKQETVAKSGERKPTVRHQEDFSKTLERPLEKEAKTLLTVTQRLKMNSAELIEKSVSAAPGRDGDPEFERLRELNQRLASELGKSVEYAEKLSTIAIGKAYREERQRKSKRRYLQAFVVALLILAPCAIYFKYGLTAEQKKSLRVHLQNLNLVEKVQQKEQEVAQTRQESQQKSATIAEKEKELQQKDQNIQQVKQTIGEKEKQLTQTREVLTQTQQELSAKAYITSQLQKLKEYAQEVRQLRETAVQTGLVLQNSQQAAAEKHSRMYKLFNEFLDSKQIWNELRLPAEESLLTMQSKLHILQESQATFLQHGKDACREIQAELAAFDEELQKRQPYLLQYAEKKMSDVRDVERQMSAIDDAYQTHHTLTRKSVDTWRQQHGQFEEQSLAAYLKVLEYYQRHAINNKTFAMVYQDIQQTEALYKTVQETKTDVGQTSVTGSKQSQELANAGGEIAALRRNFAGMYQKFLATVSDSAWGDEIAAWSEPGKSEADMSRLQAQMMRYDQTIDALMNEVHTIYQKIGKIGKYCVEARQFWEQELARKKQLSAKNTDAAKIEAKPSPVATKEPATSKTQTATKASKPLATGQLASVLDRTRSSLDMASSEFVATTKIFSRQQNQLVLQSYLIAKVFAEAYRQQQSIDDCLLAQALAPQELLGNRILQRGDVAWFYEERKNSLQRLTPQLLRVSPSQRFQQMVDFVDLNWWKEGEYQVQEGEEVTSDKGEPVYRVLLAAVRPKTFAWVYCHYSAAQEVPVRIEYCDASRTPQLVVYCRAFQTTPLGKRAVRFMVVDMANVELMMEVEYLNIGKKQFPEYIFQKESMAKLK